jgi:hypothetical protein
VSEVLKVLEKDGDVLARGVVVELLVEEQRILRAGCDVRNQVGEGRARIDDLEVFRLEEIELATGERFMRGSGDLTKRSVLHRETRKAVDIQAAANGNWPRPLAG